jgi:hypothetical protein
MQDRQHAILTVYEPAQAGRHFFFHAKFLCEVRSARIDERAHYTYSQGWM